MTTTESSPPTVLSNDAAVRPDRRLMLALGVAGVWILLLFILTIFTANPITLNRVQIQESTLIVVGTVTGKGTITRSDIGGLAWPEQDEIVIENLSTAKARVGKTYLFPLRQIGRQADGAGAVFEVTPTLLPDHSPLIYPAEPETFSQLKAITGS
ncbi:hypothetical protein [Planctomicrobium sp. SH527]|uniref:hypothetical protein n=1 Tax=Planctomicrobium sp. SH527 TaxID=3448123 RepID=UPI003F5C7E2B